MKVLLLTDIPPCRNFTAGLVLDRLVGFLPKDQVAICAVVNPALNPEIPAELDEVPKLLLRKPREAAVRVLPRKAGILSAFPFELVQANRVQRELLPQIVEFAKAQKVDAVWVVLQGQTMVRLARQVTQALNVPLLTQVWDPFGWWLQANLIDGFTRRRLLKEFDLVIKGSASCATASWAMSENYTNKYRVVNAPVIAGLPRELALQPATKVHDRDEFIIAMAGQFYAQTEWECLQHALNACNWKVAGKRIRVRVMGARSRCLPKVLRTSSIWAGKLRTRRFDCLPILIFSTCLTGSLVSTTKSRATVFHRSLLRISLRAARCFVMRRVMPRRRSTSRPMMPVSCANRWIPPSSSVSWKGLCRTARLTLVLPRTAIHAS